MTIMLIADREGFSPDFRPYFIKLGYTVIHYHNPLKAMDNLEEIHPDIIFCRANDFARHWKLIVKQVRESRTRDDAIVILHIDESFEADEAAKAAFLGVNILYPGPLEGDEDFGELSRRIARYKSTPERSKLFNWVPAGGEEVLFIFRHPTELRMIPGHFIELSAAGGVFQPDDHGDLFGLEPGTIIESGSMRAGDSLITIKARVILNAGTLSLAFVEFENDGFQCLVNEMGQHTAIV